MARLLGGAPIIEPRIPDMLDCVEGGIAVGTAVSVLTEPPCTKSGRAPVGCRITSGDGVMSKSALLSAAASFKIFGSGIAPGIADMRGRVIGRGLALLPLCDL